MFQNPGALNVVKDPDEARDPDQISETPLRNPGHRLGNRGCWLIHS